MKKMKNLKVFLVSHPLRKQGFTGGRASTCEKATPSINPRRKLDKTERTDRKKENVFTTTKT